jgi:hypothetical protein
METETFTTEPRRALFRRSVTAQRAKYEAEAQVLAGRLGGIEGARQKLGLSRREICRILLVDPSAWTRWTKPGGQPPPHIYRTLELYLAVQDKLPELATRYYQTPTVVQGLVRQHETKLAGSERLLSEIKDSQTSELGKLRLELADMRQRLDKAQRLAKLTNAALAVALIATLVTRLLA